MSIVAIVILHMQGLKATAMASAKQKPKLGCNRNPAHARAESPQQRLFVKEMLELQS
jgi:hypothetical protein